MSSNDLFGVLQVSTESFILNYNSYRSYKEIRFQNRDTDDCQKSLTEISGLGWERFSHLLFHPDGELCGVKDYFVKAAPPSDLTLPWDWVTHATLVSRSGWKSFKFLFFDPDGKLYGVKDDQLYSGTLPSNAQEEWINSAKLVGTNGWDSYDFLFFNPAGILHGVSKTGELFCGTPPMDENDDWTEGYTRIGESGWSEFKFLFFMSDGELHGVHQDNFYKGSPPTKDVSSDKWLNSSTLSDEGGWNDFKFLMSPVEVIFVSEHCA